MTETQIYIANVTCLRDEKIFAEYYGAISRRRQEKINRMRFQKDKCLSLGAEVLLRQACRDFGINYQEASIEENPYGKPYFTDVELKFNLSHSGERVMCIMSEQNVGCDVEQLEPPDLQIAKMFFSSEETAQILAQTTPDKQADYFYRIWTLKESFVKCIGSGLQTDLASFTVLIKGKSVELKQNITSSAYAIGECTWADNYRYAWCRRKSDDEAELERTPEINFIGSFVPNHTKSKALNKSVFP